MSFVRIRAVLDSKTCTDCKLLDGMEMDEVAARAALEHCQHVEPVADEIGCRCVLEEIA